MASAELGMRPLERLGPSRFVNRELARLFFDERVLAMAEDERLPLLERVRFLSIFSRKLDDFFQIRVAGLQESEIVSGAPSSSLSAARSRWDRMIPEAVTALEHIRTAGFVVGFPKVSGAEVSSGQHRGLPGQS